VRRDEERPADAEEIARVKQTLGITEKLWPVGFVMTMALVFGLVVTLIGLLSIWTAPVIQRPSGALGATAGALACYFALALWGIATDLKKRNGYG
jgi:hypothetical protein